MPYAKREDEALYIKHQASLVLLQVSDLKDTGLFEIFPLCALIFQAWQNVPRNREMTWPRIVHR